MLVPFPGPKKVNNVNNISVKGFCELLRLPFTFLHMFTYCFSHMGGVYGQVLGGVRHWLSKRVVLEFPPLLNNPFLIRTSLENLVPA